MKTDKIKTLFLDIGGVVLTNGWDHISRQKAVEHFGLDAAVFEKKHQLTFDTYELGKISFDAYLDNLLFYEKRPFSKEDFRKFIFAQSIELPGAMDFFKQLKKEHNLKVAAVSNEPREINAYRIKTFDLSSLFDFYISSCYIGIRKPDPDIFRLACDVSATAPAEVLYIDDRDMYIDVGRSYGLQCLHYKDVTQAAVEMKKFEF
ncbi:MAG: hydrolase [Bacteroidetes bacterium]|nr:hydrolase [Bacteroidota bacterium]